VPNYVDSNMTDDEFMKLLDSCLPRAIVARIGEMIENMDDADGALTAARDEIEKLEKLIPQEDQLPEEIENFDEASIATIRESLAAWQVIGQSFERIRALADAAAVAVEV
jgi:uncharacterized coiled-coil DUF342 family protein